MEKLKSQILSTYKIMGQKWLDELPDLVKKCAKKWHLDNLVKFDNLSWNYVAHGLQDSRLVVLKISLDITSMRREVSALKAFTPGSCIGVIEFDDKLGAALLEAAEPGKDLQSYNFKDPFQILTICCDVAKNIKSHQVPTQCSFDHIKNLFNNLDLKWDKIPYNMLQTAVKIKNDLMKIESENYIIHGDLHRENILSHGSEWRAIDPKGFIGNLYSEVWPFIRTLAVS